MIRKNVTPKINSEIATLAISPHYTKTKNEYDIINKLPIFDSYFSQIEMNLDTIPEVKEKYEIKLKEFNDVFDYFNNKYKKHFDTYISVSITEVFTKDKENDLVIFPTHYRDENRERINSGFWNLCHNCELQWNEDSLQNIYDEITWLVIDFLESERYGGSYIGDVKEVIDTNLISIKIKNTRVVKGMKLLGLRTWQYSKGEETLKQYISDKEDIINYYNNNPDELTKLRTKEDWRPTKWYPSAKNIDELLLLFEYEVDSLKKNYDTVLEDWKSKVNRAWDGIMSYNLRIIKITDDEAIGKIIWKKAPYVTPQKGDMIEFEE